MEFNMDIKTRDEMIFGEYNPDKYGGGVRDFEGMDVELLEKLVEMKFVDIDEYQNDSPTIKDFIEFMSAHDGYTVGGYVVTDKRDDYRVSVTSIEKEGIIDDVEELREFVDRFRYADDFDVKGFAWFD